MRAIETIPGYSKSQEAQIIKTGHQMDGTLVFDIFARGQDPSNAYPVRINLLAIIPRWVLSSEHLSISVQVFVQMFVVCAFREQDSALSLG